MPSVGLFIHSSHRHFPDVLRISEKIGKTYVLDCDADGSENDAATIAPDIVFNFVTRCVFRGFALSRPNANFHPAPPCYPGIGGASRALYDGANVFGATAHRMVKRIDAGDIYCTETVPIFDTDSSESLFARAEGACVTLVSKLASHIVTHGAMPPPSDEQWSGSYMSIRKFHDDWLRLDINNPDDMDRKLRAATHSKHPGPYVMIHGRRFVLSKS